MARAIIGALVTGLFVTGLGASGLLWAAALSRHVTPDTLLMDPFVGPLLLAYIVGGSWVTMLAVHGAVALYDAASDRRSQAEHAASLRDSRG